MSDFSIGGKLWPGISKLIEEAGEVTQVCGKLIGSRGNIHHWDGSNLKERLQEEMGDLWAAMQMVIKANDLDEDAMQERASSKLALFWKWHNEQPAPTATGETVPPSTCDVPGCEIAGCHNPTDGTGREET